mgnify:CR=1 FL=1
MVEILRWRPLLEMLADIIGVNWTVLAGQLLQESGGHPDAIGDNGRAYGLAQIHAATKNNHAFSCGWDMEELLNPIANLAVYIAEMIRLHRWLSSHWGERVRNPDWLLLSWNWGAGNVESHLNAGKGLDDIPPKLKEHLESYHEKTRQFLSLYNE